MLSATLIFPHQLFLPHPALAKNRPVWMVEEFLFFRQYHFHRQKIILHRASMQYFAETLQKASYEVHYVSATENTCDIRRLVKALKEKGIRELYYADPVDNWLHRRLKEAAQQNGMVLHCSPSSNFINQPQDLDAYLSTRKSYFQTDFYVYQRKQKKILLDINKKPLGGKWTYDTENRSKIPAGESIPPLRTPAPTPWVVEAQAYVQKHFAHHMGEAAPFIYPVTHDDAAAWLNDFLQHRFARFGVYEDAMRRNESFLFHAVLTPMLNIGLLSPQQVIDKALETAAQKAIPLNSLEGFIRQVLGWREFIRMVYEREGSKQRTTNFWGFQRKITASFWQGNTGITPVDTVIKRVLSTGYCHHIERLMVLGNFMLLCEFDPDEVYRWFMEMFVDSYDWVMVPNVYGMTQFADGGLMTTKPYISGSNYLFKMGDWEKGPWQSIWDGLFWRFMHVHRDFFAQNPRLGMLLNTFDKMPVEKRENHLQQAERFLAKLDRENHA